MSRAMQKAHNSSLCVQPLVLPILSAAFIYLKYHLKHVPHPSTTPFYPCLNLKNLFKHYLSMKPSPQPFSRPFYKTAARGLHLLSSVLWHCARHFACMIFLINFHNEIGAIFPSFANGKTKAHRNFEPKILLKIPKLKNELCFKFSRNLSMK